MRTALRLLVPTGDILIVEGEKGRLEMLSLGDYGKDVNLKADCMGLTREPKPIRHQQMLPLQEKWVITISTQYGCSMNCTFCDVPKVGPGRNATRNDMIDQVLTGMALHPEIRSTKRLNIHFARMGEPTFNLNVLDAALWCANLPDFCVHPVVSTMMPRGNTQLRYFLNEWMALKNGIYAGNAGLQLSIDSTDEGGLTSMFGGSALSLREIAEIMYNVPDPVGRKITLNFAVANYTIDPRVLLAYFNPEHYIIKLTPMHKTQKCVESGNLTQGDYTTYAPYQKHEEALKAVGYDVLVFIASKEEDESRITCGNAILSGTQPFDLGA